MMACTRQPADNLTQDVTDPAVAALIDTPAAREATKLAEQLTQRVDSVLQNGRVDSLQLRQMVDSLMLKMSGFREKADPAVALAFVAGIRHYMATNYEQLREQIPQAEQLLQQATDAEKLLLKVAEVRQHAVQALGGDSAAGKLVDGVASDVLKAGLEHLKGAKDAEERPEP